LFPFSVSRNWTDITPAKFHYIPDQNEYYFVGAIIALSSAIFSAINNIVIAKLVSFQKTQNAI
jgi:hypothetical protein